MIKGFFAMSLITLQVGTLFSCVSSGTQYDKAVFYTKEYYLDQETNQTLPLEVENIVIDLPESGKINYPYTGLITYQIYGNHKYEIDYFYVYGDSTKAKVSFPYTYDEEKDITDSWSELDSYANSVIFIAVWKKTY